MLDNLKSSLIKTELLQVAYTTFLIEIIQTSAKYQCTEELILERINLSL